MSKNNPYGDDGGTRVGRPDTPKRDNRTDARGIHDVNKKGSPARPGSEPLKERENQHKSGYGGENGKPRRS